MHLPLTPAAQRVLALAESMARSAGDAAAGAAHLIWALLHDESRAAELLLARGLSRDVLSRHLPNVEATLDPAMVPGEEVFPHSEELRLVLVELGSLASRLTPTAEIGTEHLLYALCKVNTPVRALLGQHGLHPDAFPLAGEAPTEPSVEPIPSDVRLNLEPAPASELTDAARILDAAANRAREGLRVAEDYARFVLDDKHLAGRLKGARHALTSAVVRMGSASFDAARDALADVGADLHTSQEERRESTAAVARAGLKRAQEACRALEEYGKLFCAELPHSAAAVRYELYTLEKALFQADASRKRLRDCRLYLLVTEDLCHHGSGPAVRAALAAGLKMVQVREKRWRDQELLAHCRRMRDWTAQSGALLIVNDRPDLAVLCHADGVHVGQEELSVRDARRIVGPQRLVGVSTHNIEQARRAVLEGADYLGVGPVFSSRTKSFPQLAGLDYVRDVAAEIAMPAFAIGGIDAGNIDQVLRAGARGVAVSSAICGAADPEAATRALLAALNQGAPPE
jgi:thiamine-phosphate pyrophosphorylase